MAEGHKLKEENVEDSKWRKSLKNWGHEPLAIDGDEKKDPYFA